MSKGKAEETRTTENVAGKSDAACWIGMLVERWEELSGAERLQNRNFIHRNRANYLVKFRFCGPLGVAEAVDNAETKMSITRRDFCLNGKTVLERLLKKRAPAWTNIRIRTYLLPYKPQRAGQRSFLKASSVNLIISAFARFRKRFFAS